MSTMSSPSPKHRRQHSCKKVVTEEIQDNSDIQTSLTSTDIESLAIQILGVVRLKQLPQGVHVAHVVSRQGVSVSVRVKIPVEVKTPCEVDLLAVIGDAGKPITWSRILLELERRQKIHGESTISRALSRLVRKGELNNNRTSPRGYLINNKHNETR